MTQDRRARKFVGAFRFGHDEAMHRVSVGSRSAAVMAAERPGNLLESGGALGLRLAFPVDGESLTAHAATQLRSAGSALAQDLHGYLTSAERIQPTLGYWTACNIPAHAQDRYAHGPRWV